MRCGFCRRDSRADLLAARRLAKFAGSSSISSADFYGRDEGISRDTGGDSSNDLAVNIAATAKEVSRLTALCSVVSLRSH